MGFLGSIFGNNSGKSGTHAGDGDKAGSPPRKPPAPTWLSSKVQLELLARFYHGADPWTFVGKEHWNDILGDKVEHVLDQLREEGALLPAPLRMALHHRYSAKDLQYMLGDRGLDTSGNLEEMIDRLLAADGEGMRLLTADSNVLALSVEARKAVIRYVAEERERRETAERKSLVGLLQRDYLRAALAVGEYQKDSVFSRGVGLSFNNDDQLENVQLLQKLFEKTPALLAAIDDKTLGALRPPAGMAFLWCRDSAAAWISGDLNVDAPFDAETVCMMLRSHARYLMDVEKYRDSKHNAFRIWTQNDDGTCSACRSLHGEIYALDNLPELPHPACTSASGCRCGVVTFEQAF
jgi:hypothetical protein